MNGFELQHAPEQAACLHAADGPILQIRTLEAGESLIFENSHRSFLFFLLQGSVRCRCNTELPFRIHAAEMSFMVRGDAFRFEADDQAVALTCFLDATIALCNEHSIKALSESMPDSNGSDHADLPVVLPIHDLLFSELDNTRDTMATGLLCQHYQLEKRDIFLLMLRGFYSQEELQQLFRPILSRDFAFKQQILRIYTPDMNVEEMILRSGLPATSFNRRFGKAFGTTPRQWLVNRKKKGILTDLSMGDLPIKEIACKYGFTPNYFNEFCRAKLGGKPSELRKKEAVDW